MVNHVKKMAEVLSYIRHDKEEYMDICNARF